MLGEGYVSQSNYTRTHCSPCWRSSVYRFGFNEWIVLQVGDIVCPEERAEEEPVQVGHQPGQYHCSNYEHTSLTALWEVCKVTDIPAISACF